MLQEHKLPARPVAPHGGIVNDRRVVVFLLLGWIPIPLLLALVLALYLTAYELHQLREHWLWWIWWLLLVVMTHFVGYLILRAYAVYRRRQQARA